MFWYRSQCLYNNQSNIRMAIAIIMLGQGVGIAGKYLRDAAKPLPIGMFDKYDGVIGALISN